MIHHTIERCDKCGVRWAKIEGIKAPHHCEIPCRHRGDPWVGKDAPRAWCQTCGGGPGQVLVWRCERHGKCVKYRPTPDPDLPAWSGAVCAECPDFAGDD